MGLPETVLRVHGYGRPHVPLLPAPREPGQRDGTDEQSRYGHRTPRNRVRLWRLVDFRGDIVRIGRYYLNEMDQPAIGAGYLVALVRDLLLTIWKRYLVTYGA